MSLKVSLQLGCACFYAWCKGEPVRGLQDGAGGKRRAIGKYCCHVQLFSRLQRRNEARTSSLLSFLLSSLQKCPILRSCDDRRSEIFPIYGQIDWLLTICPLMLQAVLTISRCLPAEWARGFFFHFETQGRRARERKPATMVAVRAELVFQRQRTNGNADNFFHLFYGKLTDQGRFRLCIWTPCCTSTSSFWKPSTQIRQE